MARIVECEFTVYRGDEEITLHCTGEVAGAEPDVGIMGAYLDDFTAQVAGSHEEFNLTDDERERLETKLLEGLD